MTQSRGYTPAIKSTSHSDLMLELEKSHEKIEKLLDYAESLDRQIKDIRKDLSTGSPKLEKQ